MSFHHLNLIVVDGIFAICKLAADAPIPPWASVSHFFSITRTADELSIVCHEDAVPEDVVGERGWRCLRVAGTMPFSVVGVLASLTAPLAEASISVFAVSTFAWRSGVLSDFGRSGNGECASKWAAQSFSR